LILWPRANHRQRQQSACASFIFSIRYQSISSNRYINKKFSDFDIRTNSFRTKSGLPDLHIQKQGKHKQHEADTCAAIRRLSQPRQPRFLALNSSRRQIWRLSRFPQPCPFLPSRPQNLKSAKEKKGSLGPSGRQALSNFI
jgi:hypothetical protein